MTLVRGTRLGAYEILSALGAGGMGEMYAFMLNFFDEVRWRVGDRSD